MRRLALIPLIPLVGFTACIVPGPRGRVAIIAPIPVPVVRFSYVDREPPPVRREPVPPPPAPDHYWAAGHWTWDGHAYLWVPGAWHRRVQPSGVWVDGHWDRQPQGWVWIEGHWR